jgi:serine/threonine protein kinase
MHGTSGTLAYMSPQQITGERATHLDDIYSIGATIYELLTGKPPFYSGDITDQIKSKVPEQISQRRTSLSVENAAAIPPQWDNTIRACLAKEPRERPQQAAEIIQRLGLIGREPPTITTVPPPVIPVPQSVPPAVTTAIPPVISPSRNTPWLIVSAAILVGLLAISYALLSRRESNPPERSATVQPPPLSSPTRDASARLAENASKIQPPVIPAITPELTTATIAVQTPAPVTETRAPVISTTVPPPTTTTPASDEQFPETRNRLVTQTEVRGWSDTQLRYAINELYARGGYDFQNAEIKAYFSRFAWYRQRLVPGRTQPVAAAQLSRLEYANLELLQKIRDSRR